MMLLLTLRGTPTIYYGDEIGMLDVNIPPELEQDPWGKNVAGIGLGRDPERTPMQWDDSPNAGFSPSGVATWLPVANDYAKVNVATELNDPRSMLSLTRRLLALRRTTAALHSGSYQTVKHPHDTCLVFMRQQDSERWLVALNFAASDQTLSIGGTGQIVLSTELDREEAVNLGALQLRAYEGCIIKLD